MRTLHPDLTHLPNIIRFAPDNETHARRYKAGPDQAFCGVAP
jgi:hypothetical protein